MENLHEKDAAAVRIPVLVTQRDQLAMDVIGLRLSREDGVELPDWSPGSHVDVVVDTNLVRQYSLCGDPEDRSSYYLGIQRDRYSRGGSEILVEQVQVGHRLLISAPRNHFGLTQDGPVVLVAGGIGITPLRPMVQRLAEAGIDWTLEYGGRSRRTMAFADEMLHAYPHQVRLVPEDECGRLELETIAKDAQARGATVYACGPDAMLTALEKCCQQAEVSFRSERFAPKEAEGTATDTEFDVQLARAGITLRVPIGTSILDAVSNAGVETFSSCREGTCGSCEATVLAGEIDHRDSLLLPEEQEAQDVMMICVSRASSPLLVLDL